jgi:predicted nucleic acid-binding protein
VTDFLLDTNVISEYSRVKAPDPGVRRWVDAQDEESLYLSVLTFGEIRKGASLLPSGNRRTQLEAWLQIDLPLRFKSRVLPIDEMTAELWGAMAAEAQLKGIALAVIDGLVAATAKRHGLTVATRNVKDSQYGARLSSIPGRDKGNPVINVRRFTAWYPTDVSASRKIRSATAG